MQLQKQHNIVCMILMVKASNWLWSTWVLSCFNSISTCQSNIAVCYVMQPYCSMLTIKHTAKKFIQEQLLPQERKNSECFPVSIGVCVAFLSLGASYESNIVDFLYLYSHDSLTRVFLNDRAISPGHVQVKI